MAGRRQLEWLGIGLDERLHNKQAATCLNYRFKAMNTMAVLENPLRFFLQCARQSISNFTERPELETCCLPLIQGHVHAATCESLMRARYTAFVVGAWDYLSATWHPATRPKTMTRDSETQWLGLRVIATHQGLAQDKTGTVEFIARSKTGGSAHRLHEVSRFVREQGLWFYLDGDLKPQRPR